MEGWGYMKILFIEWDSFGKEDIKEAFYMEGHELILFPVSMEEDLDDAPELEGRLSAVLHQETPAIVFSINYFPAISNTCNREGIRYISWVYDAPYVRLYSQTVLNPCNCVYVFDRELCMEFRNAGVETVCYLPLAVNTERLDAMSIPADTPDFQYDVSFVGSFYVEKNDYYDQMVSVLPDFAKGYLDAIIAAQMKIQGYDFIEDVLGPVINDLYKAFPLDPDPRGMESREYLYAQYVVDRRITTLERIDLLNAVAKRHNIDVFTYIKDFTMPNMRNHGRVDYFNEMPLVFRQSRINLNISRRGIKSGIPLRAFDIMGSGGFLLSNFQADFLDFFVPGEDFMYYESKEDFLEKNDYFLFHEEERQVIAKNGHDKVAAKHTYRHRVREMLSAL